MHHLRQSDIAVELRQPHIRAERRRIQEALRYGGHSEQHRRYLEYQLSILGKPRVYSDDTIPRPPGAIELGEPPVEVELEGATYESLSTFRFTDLHRKAQDLGVEVPTPTTKAKIITILLDTEKPK